MQSFRRSRNEGDPETGLFVGFVPGFSGAHSQGVTLDELNDNLRDSHGDRCSEDGQTDDKGCYNRRQRLECSV